jgi:putative ABC transport system permease protein
MLEDLKAAGRSLIKNRWFAAITALTLAIGIGANTAMFAVVSNVLLNPLPYHDSDRIVYVRRANERISYVVPAFVALAWQDQSQSLQGVEAFAFRDVLAGGDDGARVLIGMRSTPGLPTLLGVSPLLGRTFTSSDVQPGAPAVVILSYEAWQRDFGGMTNVLGRSIALDDVAHTVIGVMPARWDAFTAGFRGDVHLPLPLGPLPPSLRDLDFVQVLGRLQPDATFESATAELDAISAAALEGAPPMLAEDRMTTRIEGPSARVGPDTRKALVVLLAAVALVLLIACSNVANLLLARGATRVRETALRSALGASAWRVVRALLAECLVISLAAGMIGVVLGWITLRLVMQLRPATLSYLGELHLDSAALAFTLALSIATTFLFGVAPALQLKARGIGDALRHGAVGVVRASSGRRWRKWFLAAQMALSVVLLLTAGLLVRSVIDLQRVDVGFEPKNLFAARLSLPRARYAEAPSREVLSRQLLERIRSSPGIAGVTQALLPPPLALTFVGPWEVRGASPSDADSLSLLRYNTVRPDYFATVGIPMLAGRSFSADETLSGSEIIVNRAAERRFWPSGSALGSEVKQGAGWATVIGVVDNIINDGLRQNRDEPQFYMPFSVRGAPVDEGFLLVARADSDPAIAIASLRAATREVDPGIAIREVILTETALANSIDGPRFNMALLATFSVIALVLAAVGLAAVIGYEITERKHEIGIRIALGATTENVLRFAMKHGLVPSLIGIGIGFGGAFAVTQVASTLTYGAVSQDPFTLVAVLAVLVVVALGASWIPAHRAARVDPMTALRAD